MLLLTTMLAIATLLGWAVVLHRRQRRLARELQASRAETQALAQSLDVWQWRCDSQGRLVALRAPRGRPFDALATVPTEKPFVWDHFCADESARLTLRSLLVEQAPFDGLQLPQNGKSGHWLLNATPTLDPQGCFNGHVGTARELVDPHGSLVHGLLESFPMPVLRFRVDVAGGSDRSPVFVGGNAAVAAWLGENPPALMPLLEILHLLPSSLRASVEHLLTPAPGRAPEVLDGWTVHKHILSSGPLFPSVDLLLIFQQTADPESFAARVAEEDHASFTYTVSHDLRAPIRVVEGFTKIVKEDYGLYLDRIGNDHLDRVLGAAARMNSMIDALLALSQLTSRPLTRQPVNLSQLAGYIVDDLRRQSPERQVQVDIDPGLQAHGDATLLRVVLENLLGNAWKYTSKCRVARIWVERSEHEGRPAVTIRDNGAGFDMRFADRLFGVFQRLHSANDFQGTGVGLASVRRIVRRHGGDIWGEGEVDRGARFQFWLGPPN